MQNYRKPSSILKKSFDRRVLLPPQITVELFGFWLFFTLAELKEHTFCHNVFCHNSRKICFSFFRPLFLKKNRPCLSIFSGLWPFWQTPLLTKNPSDQKADPKKTCRPILKWGCIMGGRGAYDWCTLFFFKINGNFFLETEEKNGRKNEEIIYFKNWKKDII